jgi:FKBP-type peptidyl-prolyl cis-trans isomerase SlyD
LTAVNTILPEKLALLIQIRAGGSISPVPAHQHEAVIGDMDAKDDDLALVLESKDLIEKDKVVRLRFWVSDLATGGLLQYGDDLFYLHGGYGGAFPKVEQALEGRGIGEAVELMLSPEEGYGHRDPALVLRIPGEDFGEELPEPGAPVEGRLDDGQTIDFMVVDVSRDGVIVDGNHPFAGKQLGFQFEVLEVRDSIEAERAAGFAFDGMF